MKKKPLTTKERAAARAADWEKTLRIRAISERNRIANAERARNRPPGTIADEFEVRQMLRVKYGISDAGTKWMLHEAPYRPPEVEGYDFDYGLVGRPDIPSSRHATAWNDKRIDDAAQTFITECRQESPTLWSHPKVKGRFKLRHQLAS